MRLGTSVAWLNLTYKPSRLLLSLSGIIFAAILMFMFTGFENALYDSQLQIFNKLNGSVFIVSRNRPSLGAPEQFPLRVLYQVQSYQGVEAAYPLYLGEAFWKNPDNQLVRMVRVIGFNPDAPLFQFPELQQYQSELRLPFTVMVDRNARPELGRKQRGVETELSNRQVRVIGNFDLGNDFATMNGNLVTSEENFARYFSNRDPKEGNRSLDRVDLGVIFLEAGAQPDQVAATLKQALPTEVSVYTRSELVAWERRAWQEGSNIGLVFGILTWMGFVIGIVLCYQILYADIADHLTAYATLKAIGYNNFYLVGIVVQQAILLSLLAFIPASIISYFLYQLSISFTGLIFLMTPDRLRFILTMTLLMCAISGLVSIFKVQRSDPADVF